MSLEIYNQKRDFTLTPEPPGRKLAGKGHSYVIQKHEASHLHYDFRLEIDGVLKSWAVPKGPSLDPNDKRLAVQTEDHPLDYGDFEGVIPSPGYGAGTVMLWDVGQWQPEGAEQQGLARGKLTFELKGKRLKGRWSLVKLRGKKTSGKEWLLVKQDDEYADDAIDITDKHQRSAVSRRAMATIAKEGSVLGAKATSKKSKKPKGDKKASPAEAVDQTLEQMEEQPAAPASRRGKNKKSKQAQLDISKMDGATQAPMPDAHSPQLATLYKSVPTGSEWLHEIKYDGYRLIARKRESLQLLTRNQKDWTQKFPVIAQALESLPQAELDGELVFLKRSGASSFEALQEALSAGRTDQLIYYIFDIPYYDGYDLMQVPLRLRKQAAKAAVEQINHPQIRYSEHIEGNGELVHQHACQHRLEGIISKEGNSFYYSKRSDSWRKIKCTQRQEFVVVGFTEPAGSRSGFGALLLGYYEGKKLLYAGKVGTGFSGDALTSLRAKLDKLARKTKPISDTADEARAHWVRPVLVAEVEFTEWTSANRLRHPSFLGLREDKPAHQIVREAPADRNADGAAGNYSHATHTPPAIGINISSPQKVLYPQAGITKQDLAQYYLSVAERMLPHVVNRPLSLVRCPQGHTRHCFFQKHPTEGFGAAVKLIDIEEKSGVHEYAYIDSAEGLVELVQMGTLEIHAWGSKIDDVDKPDTLIFDLDPDEGVSWTEIKAATLELRAFLGELGLVSFLKTTGGKGLHLVVPVTRRRDWDETKRFCKAVAEAMVARRPDAYIATASKAKRKNKIFVDYLRNGRGATAVTCFSTRGRTNAPVAVPLHWDELDQLESSQAYSVGNIGMRLKLSSDPWQGYHEARQSITKKAMRAVGVDPA